MKLWRLEARNGLGVFAAGLPRRMPSRVLEGGRARDPGRHPIPREEGLDFDEEWFCGFSSLAQYKLWFNTREQREWLERQGVTLKQYKVHSCFYQRGKAQVVFKIRCAKHIASRKPTSV